MMTQIQKDSSLPTQQQEQFQSPLVSVSISEANSSNQSVSKQSNHEQPADSSNSPDTYAAPVISRGITVKNRKKLTLDVKLLPKQLRRRKPDFDRMDEMKTSVLQSKHVLYGVFTCHGHIFYYDKKSLFIFDHEWRIRRAIVWLVEWRLFKIFILLAVVANSIFLASHSYEYRIDPSLSENTQIEKTSSKVFVSIFIIEFVLKVIAMGLVIKKHSYMRSFWNVLDFICLVTAIMEQTSVNAEIFSIFKTLRVLKPLRSIKAMPSLQLLVQSLFASLAGLLNVYMLLAFILSFFAIFGVNILSGYNYRACRAQTELSYLEDEITGAQTPYWPKISSALCNTDAVCEERHGAGAVCGSIWYSFGLNPKEFDGVVDNPLIFYGVPGFDNFSQALLTVFQVCTMEGWSYIMYNYAESSDYPFGSYIFFTALVMIGAFFTLNLILAQIIITFDKQQSKISDKKKKELLQEAKEAFLLAADKGEGRLAFLLVPEKDRQGNSEQIMSDSVDSQASSSKSQNQRLSDQSLDKNQSDRKNNESRDKSNEAAEANESFKFETGAAKNNGHEGQQTNHKHYTREVDNDLSQPAIVLNHKQDSIFSQSTKNKVSENLPPLEKQNQNKKSQTSSFDNLACIEKQKKSQANPEQLAPDHQNVKKIRNLQMRSIKNIQMTEQAAQNENSKQVTTQQLNNNITKIPLTGPTLSDEFGVSTNMDGVYLKQHFSQIQNPVDSHMTDEIIFKSFKDKKQLRNRKNKPIITKNQFQCIEETKLSDQPYQDQASMVLDSSQVSMHQFDDSQNELQAKDFSEKNENTFDSDGQEANLDDIEAFAMDFQKNVLSKQQPAIDQIDEQSKGKTKELSQKQKSCCQKTVQVCYKIVCSPLFNITIIMLILMNTFVLADYHFEQSVEQAQRNQILECFFGAAFTAECALKLAGFGLKDFTKDRFNILDAIIVLTTLLELILFFCGVENIRFIDLLRAFRAMRLLKLARYNQEMRHLVYQTIKSLFKISGFCVVLLLFIFIWALLGMEFFAYQAVMDEEGNFIKPVNAKKMLDMGEISKIDYPRQNFNDIWASISSVYILIMGEDWNVFMNMLVRVYDQSYSWVPQIYCVIGIIIGNLTILALFTGILCQTFSEQTKTENEEGQDQNQVDFDEFWIKKSGQTSKCSRSYCFGGLKRIYLAFGSATKQQTLAADNGTKNQIQAEPLPKESLNSQALNKEEKTTENIDTNITLLHYINLFEEQTKASKSVMEQILTKKEVKMKGKSLGLLSIENKLRQFCWIVSQHKAFDIFILILIVLSTFFLVFESPLKDPNSPINQFFSMASNLFLIFYVLEAIIKIIAQGLIKNGKRSYLKNNWNVLDFVIVISSLIDVSLSSQANISVTRVFRSLRILRPIRIVAKNQRLQVALTSFLKSMPKIMKLQLLTMFMLFIIAIFQTNLFSGTFYRCYTEHLNLGINQRSQLILTKWDCLNYGGEWIRPDLNFDTISDSMVTLSSISSTEGWTSVLWDITDSKDIDVVPFKNYKELEGKIYTFAVMFFISLILVNLFVGVVVETFNRQKVLSSYNQVLRPAQRNYLEVLLMTFQHKPLKKLNFDQMKCIRKWSIKVTQHKCFEVVILVAILTDTIIIGSYHFMLSDVEVENLSTLNLFFVILFTLEAVMKIIAQKRGYFKDRWNQFDFIILFLAYLLLIAIRITNIKELDAVMRTIRVCRIIKLLKLIKLVVNVKKMDHLQRTLVDTAPVLGSFGLLLFLFIYMFTVVGVQFFSMNSLDSADGVTRELNERVNFQTFGTAFLTMLRCATGEGWNTIMLETSWQKSILYQCNPNETYDTIIASGRDPENWEGPRGCGEQLKSYFFFGLFQFLITQVYLNLVIAIIVDAFTGVLATEKLPINDRLIDEFVKQWSKYDPEATNFIEINLMDNLLESLSISPNSQDLFIFHDSVAQSQKFRHRMISTLEIPTFGNLKYVMFYDVLQMLCFRAFKMKYNKETLQDNFRILNVISKMQNKNPGTKLRFEAADQANLKKDYMMNFDQETLKKFQSFNDRIELINKLRQKTIILQKQFCHLVDTTRDIGKKKNGIKLEEDLEGETKFGPQPKLFTSKHYIAGGMILKYWRIYLTQNSIENNAITLNQATQMIPES